MNNTYDVETYDLYDIDKTSKYRCLIANHATEVSPHRHAPARAPDHPESLLTVRVSSGRARRSEVRRALGSVPGSSPSTPPCRRSSVGRRRPDTAVAASRSSTTPVGRQRRPRRAPPSSSSDGRGGEGRVSLPRRGTPRTGQGGGWCEAAPALYPAAEAGASRGDGIQGSF